MKHLTKKIMLLLIVALSVVAVAGCNKKNNTKGKGEYTYRLGTSVFPTNWNPHTYQTDTDSDILDYTSSGFYEFDYNETETGYQVVPAMATQEPIDVTSQYVGQYGVKNGETAKVYKIKLRSDLKWSNGDPITAQSFVNSAKLLLNPVAQNYRADSLYTGNLEIFNALNYLYQGKHAYVNEFVSEDYGDEEYVAMSDFVVDENGVLRLPEGHEFTGQDVAINLKSGGNWGSNGLSAYAGAKYFESEKAKAAWEALSAAAKDDVVVMTETTVRYVQDLIAVLHGYEDAAAYAAPKGTYEELYPEYLIGYYSQFLEKYGEDWAKAWEEMPAVSEGETKGKDAFAEVTYKVLVVTGEGEEAVYSWTEKTGVTTAEEYAAYKSYVNADAYAKEDATTDSSENDYAYREWEEMAFIGKDYTDLDFSEVGVFVDAEGDLCIALVKPLEGFYLLYSLSGTWLVHEETYNKNIKMTSGVYSNSYGTSVDTFESYGPYKLTQFISDKEYVLEKNENWYGYNDEANKDLYQTTKIVVKYIKETSTKLDSFIKGEIDVYGLTSDDMAEYGASDYLYYSKGSSTFFVAFNPSLEGLKTKQAATAGTNKTILTIKDFRKAMSLALDRVQFCLACNPTGSAATAVFNSLIISDPDAGTPYRNSEEAKDIILEFWGLTDQVGEGKRYATKDEAIASISGVDVAQAKELFTSAYQQAKEAGLISDSDVVELKIGLPSTNPFYTKGYDFLSNCWAEAVKGTPLEGRIRFTKDDTLGNGFADALRNNDVDILFGVGWTGAALNPYGLINAYTLPSYQYDPSIDYTTIVKDVTFPSVTDAEGVVHENVTLRASVADWSNNALQGTTITTYVVGADGETTKEMVSINAGTQMPMENRCRILWACEAAILEQYTLLPLTDESSAVLKGQKIKYHTEEEIFGMGRGGIKYMTYNYDDAEWDKYVKAAGGKLNYK